MWKSGKSANDVVKEQGLVQITDTGALEELVKKIIEANPQSVADYKAILREGYRLPRRPDHEGNEGPGQPRRRQRALDEKFAIM